MTTPALVSLAITAIGSDAVISTARAFNHTAAWTPALRAHAGLLIAELDTLAITIGEHDCGAFHSRAGDHHGPTRPDQLPVAPADPHHAATESELADQLAPSALTRRPSLPAGAQSRSTSTVGSIRRRRPGSAVSAGHLLTGAHSIKFAEDHRRMAQRFSDL